MRNYLSLMIIVLWGIWNNVANAAIPNRELYDKYFEIDLKKELPTYEELQKNYMDKYTMYNRKYDWHWNIGNIFNAAFRVTISTYGGTEKRVKARNEELMLTMLELLPPEYYQYIGPYLHTIPSMSEKVLNLPGIKETKNKFPSRIAPQLADVEDLEFLSPYLYFFLMPEAWPGNQSVVEVPRPKVMPVKIEKNTELYDLVKQIVPAEEFYQNADIKKTVGKSDLRTIEITKNSPLSSGDIKAFLQTLSELNEIRSDDIAMAKIYGAGTLLDVWEREQGIGLPINTMKDVIFPCQRLVQKMRIAGEENYLKYIVAKNGFTPEEWAYTCDKTIRAYRMTTLSKATAMSLKAYSLGVYDDYSRQVLGDKNAEMQFLNMQAALRMHEVPRDDILEVYKNRDEVAESFRKAGYSIIAAPIVISN